MAAIRMPDSAASHAKPVIGKAILCMGRTPSIVYSKLFWYMVLPLISNKRIRSWQKWLM